jgi:hypothetical protein
MPSLNAAIDRGRMKRIGAAEKCGDFFNAPRWL